MQSLILQLAGLGYGGDYNPEQWSPEVWREDVALMREAGVNLVTVGVFSWAFLEPAPGRYEFGWLDEVMDLLADHGIFVDLATGTASPPPWFSHAHPESLPVDADGRRLWYGSRQAFCPSSPVYRQAAAALVEQLATRYADHPALALWHVHNEYGCHNPRCYCDVSAAAFRTWLRRRYGSLDDLNRAWGTAFWSQRYTAWEQILPPRATPTFPNPTQLLDFQRFCSDELLECYRLERDILRRITPDVPVTTNLMAASTWELDYWAWGRELDVVSNDHYLWAADPHNHIGLSLAADLTRSLAGGRPWLLMEHSTSAVNWQPRNVAKKPGQARRNSLTHIARGADGALFFQWRASAAGAEKFHSGMVPHAGTDSKIWREVVRLGSDLRSLAEVAGSTVEADVAILLDYSSIWAQEQDSHPSRDMTAVEEIRAWHRTLWRAGITADFAHPGGDLSRYRLVLAPALYLLSAEHAAALASYVHEGGSLVVGPFSGIADENDHIWLGGYPGALRDLLGVRVEEFFPLLEGETIPLSNGATGRIWSELGRATDAEVLATFASGPVAGSPALTRKQHGSGTAWYVATRFDDDDLGKLLSQVTEAAGVRPTVEAPAGVEAVRRRHPDGRTYLFLINHTDDDVTISVEGKDLLTGRTIASPLRLPAGDVAVLQQ